MEDTLLFVKHVEDIAKYIHFANKNIEVDSQEYHIKYVNVHMFIKNYRLTESRVDKIDITKLPATCWKWKFSRDVN